MDLKIRQNQNFALMPIHAVASSVAPVIYQDKALITFLFFA